MLGYLTVPNVSALFYHALWSVGNTIKCYSLLARSVSGFYCHDNNNRLSSTYRLLDIAFVSKVHWLIVNHAIVLSLRT